MDLLIHLVVIDSIRSLAFLRSRHGHIWETWDVFHFVPGVEDAQVLKVVFGEEVLETLVKVALNEVNLLIILVNI